MKTLLTIFLLGALIRSLGAAEITGSVQQVNGKTATVLVQGDLVPAAGDQAEIFFKIAGVDEEVSVANGTVEKVEGGSVQLKIENATGEVAKDQLVRFKSEKPQKRTTAAPAIGPGRDPSFAFVDMQKLFAAAAETKAAEAELNAKRNEAKDEFTRRSSAGEAGVEQWRAEKEKELAEQAGRLRGTIVAQLLASVRQAADGKGLVIDTSGLSQNGFSLFFIAPPAAAEITSFQGARGWKIALVDLASVFNRFRKTKDAENEINASKNAAKKTYDDMVARSANGAKDNFVADWRATQEKELAELSARKQKEIVSEIMEKIRSTLVTDALLLAIDSGANSAAGTPLVLYHNGVPEFGDQIVAALNGTPAPAAATPRATADLQFACVDLERVWQRLGQTKAEERRRSATEKILPAVRELGTSGKHNLIFDCSGQSLNGVPFLVSTSGVPDLTDELISRLK